MAPREAQAKEMAQLGEGKQTQSTADLRGLGIRTFGPRNHPCEALRGVNLRILRGTVGSMMTFKAKHKHLAQRHELIGNPDQYHLLQEGLSGPSHQLLCWWLLLRPLVQERRLLCQVLPARFR